MVDEPVTLLHRLRRQRALLLGLGLGALSAVLIQLRAPTAGLMMSNQLNAAGGKLTFLPHRQHRGGALQQDQLGGSRADARRVALAAHVHGRAAMRGPELGFRASDLPDLVAATLDELVTDGYHP